MVPTPLTGEEVQSAIKELPRDPEIGARDKRLAEEGPSLPGRGETRVGAPEGNGVLEYWGYWNIAFKRSTPMTSSLHGANR
jgi:hypothetical protein